MTHLLWRDGRAGEKRILCTYHVAIIPAAKLGLFVTLRLIPTNVEGHENVCRA